MTDDELCIHDLEPNTCSICLHGVQATSLTIDAEFNAIYDGDCRGCDLAIVPGQRIYRLSDGAYVHRGCEPVGTSF
jgi:hypothetical protein